MGVAMDVAGRSGVEVEGTMPGGSGGVACVAEGGVAFGDLLCEASVWAGNGLFADGKLGDEGGGADDAKSTAGGVWLAGGNGFTSSSATASVVGLAKAGLPTPADTTTMEGRVLGNCVFDVEGILGPPRSLTVSACAEWGDAAAVALWSTAMAEYRGPRVMGLSGRAAMARRAKKGRQPSLSRIIAPGEYLLAGGLL